MDSDVIKFPSFRGLSGKPCYPLFIAEDTEPKKFK